MLALKELAQCVTVTAPTRTSTMNTTTIRNQMFSLIGSMGSPPYFEGPD